MPFSLLDAIAVAQAESPSASPGAARPQRARLRRSTADEQDGSASLQSVDCSERSSSSSSSSLCFVVEVAARSSADTGRVEEREASIRALEERQEPEDVKLLSLRSSQPGHVHAQRLSAGDASICCALRLCCPACFPPSVASTRAGSSLIAQQQRVRATGSRQHAQAA